MSALQDFLSPSGHSAAWLAMLADTSIKGTALLLLAGLVIAAMRRASAASRHLVWCLALTGTLALPVLSRSLPAWRVLPAPRQTPATSRVQPTQKPLPAVFPEIRAATDVPPRALAVESDTSRHNAAPIAPTDPPFTSRGASDFGKRTSGSLSTFASWLEQSSALSAIWVAGVLLVLAPVLIGAAHVRHLTRRSERLTGDPWATWLNELARDIGLVRRVTLLRSPRATMPMTWGIGRPVVLLPADADEWPPERSRIVLLHELAHVRRWDCLTQMLARLACALYWFHPLVWLAARGLRVERERACDDVVLGAGQKPSDYAGHLLEIARSHNRLRCAPIAGVAMVRRSHIESRLRAILDASRRRRTLGGITVGLSLLLGAGIVLPLAMMKAAAQRPAAETNTVLVVRWEGVLDGATADRILAVRRSLPSQSTIPSTSPLAPLFRPMEMNAVGVAQEAVSAATGVRPVTTNSKPYEANICDGEMLVQLTREALDSGRMICLDRRLRWVEPFKNFERADTWSCADSQSGKRRLSYTCGLAGFYSFETSGTFARLSLRYPSVNASLTEATTSTAQIQQGSIAWKGSLPAGQAITFIGPMQGTDPRKPCHIIVWEAVACPTDLAAYVPALTDAEKWLRNGPAGAIRTSREGLAWNQWAEAHPPRTSAQWKRTTPKGDPVKLVAVGLPKEMPFRWWDGDGQPTVGDPAWNRDNTAENLSVVLVVPDTEATTRPMPLFVTQSLSEDKSNEPPKATVGIGYGLWRDAGRLSVGKSTRIGDTTYTIEKIEPGLRKNTRTGSPGSIVVSMRFVERPENDIALAIVDKAGAPTLMGSLGVRFDEMSGNAQLYYQSALVDLDDVDYFILKTRPRFWTTFSGFAVKPAVEVPMPAIASEQHQAETVPPAARPNATAANEATTGGGATKPPGRMFRAAEVIAYHQQVYGERKSPQELAKFYSDQAIRAASSGSDPVLLVEVVERALALEKDAAVRVQLFTYLGDAYWRQTKKYTPEIWGPQRRKAAEIYLTGLRDVLQFDLPAEPPELPGVGIFNIDGPPEAIRKAQEEHDRQMAARKNAEFERDMVHRRQVLTGQLVQMYAKEPDAFDELRDLVMKHLGSAEAADQLIAGAKEYRENPKPIFPVLKKTAGQAGASTAGMAANDARIAAAKANLDAAKAKADATQQALNRALELRKANLTSDAEVDGTRAALAEAQAQLAAAEATLARNEGRGVEAANLAAAQARLDAARVNVDVSTQNAGRVEELRKKQLASETEAGAAKVALAEAQAQLAAAEAALAESKGIAGGAAKLAAAQAQLDAARVKAEVARQNADRVEELHKRKVASAAEADAAKVALAEDQAQLAASEAAVKGLADAHSTSGAAQMKQPRLQLRWVARDTDTSPADEMTQPSSPSSQSQTLRVLREVLLDETAVASASVAADFRGTSMVLVTLDQTARARFEQITDANINRRLAIVFDGHLICAPVIRSRISGGRVVIDGNFTRGEAETIARALCAKAAAAPSVSETAPTSTTEVNRYEGPFEVNKNIHASLRVGRQGDAGRQTFTVQTDWIRFFERDGSAMAGLMFRVGPSNIVRINWRFAVEFLGESDRVLGRMESAMQTNVYDQTYQTYMPLTGGQWSDVSKATKFRFTIERAPDDSAVTAHVTLEPMPSGKEAVAAAATVATSEASLSNWGEPTDGVQCRLRAEKTVWKAGETLILQLDARNEGSRNLTIAPAAACEIEVDGRWFVAPPVMAAARPFEPGRRYDAVVISLAIGWQSKDTHEPLRLTPGKHRVCAAFGTPPFGPRMDQPETGGRIRAFSNPVSIEIAR